VLHVDPATIKRGVGYCVAVAKATLAEVKTSRRGPRSLQFGPARNQPQAKERVPKRKRVT
jgi:hypothetical protein